MFYSIEVPEILDNSTLVNLPTKETFTPQDLIHFQKVDQLRQEFKSELGKERLKFNIQNQINILSKQANLDQYLKTNVETMKILILRSKDHPKYQYKLFISKFTPKYQTDNITIEEACGCEIVMARYIYSLAFNNNAYPIISRIKYLMVSQPDNINPNDIKQALQIISTGIAPLQRLCNVMDDLLKFLVTKQQSLIPELKMAIIFAIKSIIECNMNFLFIEQLRLQKQFDQIAQICRTTYSKLNDAFQRLNTQRDDINLDIFEYCQEAQTYYRLYGIWAILMINEKDILYERFKQKGYQVLTSENVKIANDIVNKIKEIGSNKKQSENAKFIQQFANVTILPTLSKSLNIYSKNTQAAARSPDDLFMSLAASFDYCDILKQGNQQ